MTFTLLWTGTFLHDQFFSNDARRQTIASEKFLSSASGPASLEKQNSCPCTSHLHSPFAANELKYQNIEFASSIQPLCALFINHLLTLRPSFSPERFELWKHIDQPPAKVAVYITHRSLLI